MAQKGLFFNAFPNAEYETGYDRNYSADDISNWLRVAFTNGVVKTDNEAGTGEPQGLKALAATGLNVSVNAGFACIDGKPYINDSSLTLSIATAPTGASPRYDLIILRMDNTQTVGARKTYLFVQTGTNEIPTVGDLTRNDDIYDLLIGYVAVQPNATAIQQSNITDTRGDETLCPWFTAVKGYDDYYDAIIQRFESNVTLQSSSTTVITDLAASLYNNRYSLIDVYTNGLKEEDTDYTIGTNSSYITITFTTAKSAGANISVILKNFIDGEGLQTAISSYNEWVNDVETLKTAFQYNYLCNGVNDNEEIVNIVNNFLATGAYYRTLKLNIIGSFGYTAPMSGDGSAASPYIIFNFNDNAGAKRYELDFTHATNTAFSVESGKQTIIFKGNNMAVRGGTFVANNQDSGTTIIGFYDQGRVKAQDCRFYLYGYSGTVVSNRGTFVNCKATVRNASGNSFCFQPIALGFVILFGGEYLAYTGQSSARSAVVGLTGVNAVAALTNVVAPTSAVSGYYQTNSIYHTNGRVTSTGLISALTVQSTTNASITGTIAVSVYNIVW